ncbi:fatty acyl-CoA reductase wat-like [Spodoptera litura]|uniref:Fatty acyl-CoA reductase n=1 Tax=Spodoptera litura TaxID=69820 RepID=A0A9J7EGJ9_SPOLT|nr:fatty acyl-CoA reductase wat-like [Spodoptera litura]
MATETLDPAQAFMAEITDRFKPLHDITARGTSSVQQFYSGATVFLTGGSGFLGKQLIEKLLRATKVSKIYVLLRCKKGKSIQQRLLEMLTDPLYDTLREQQPEFVDKIVAMEGDVSELKLGLNDKDWNTIADEVDIIFHLAATTRFDETLKRATFINVRGTREMLDISKACKKLRSFVYVSTAYTYASADRINDTVQEKFYPSPLSPETMIGIAETMEEERINDIATSMIKSWPNTYTFTKAVAESLVKDMGKDLPICVVRPAIVVATMREPTPGWLDMSCIYGASGFLFALGLGVMHVSYVRLNNQLDIVPVDYVNNAIIVAAWETARTKRTAPHGDDIKIYTIVSSSRNLATWNTLEHFLVNEARKYVTPKAVGYGFVWCTNNRLLFWLYTWLLHLIPAYIIDVIAVIFGYNMRFAKLARKLQRMNYVLAYFVTNGWQFEDQNTVTLLESLPEDDREIFNFDVTNINWTEYIIIWCLGLRKYFVKDGLTGTLYARKKNMILKIATFILLPLYFYGLFKLVYSAVAFVQALMWRWVKGPGWLVTNTGLLTWNTETSYTSFKSQRDSPS